MVHRTPLEMSSGMETIHFFHIGARAMRHSGLGLSQDFAFLVCEMDTVCENDIGR